ncbi:MAG: prepilin-type N-terminal cleavage/methylation domain-containing protein [Thermodesulfovibrionales bacterium]|nr:prepilin-type N-terminal cleavage/methylation domain-containing protein [Thermodesulfovibrionales bacterium]
MLHIVCNNNKGISLVEVLIAMAVVVIGVLAVLGVFTQAYNASTKSDGLGRAAEILHRTLERNELRIMNPSCAIPSGGTETVYSSGQSSAKPGDIAYTVITQIQPRGTNAWLVTVTVRWAQNQTGIKESIIVTRQDAFKTVSSCV